MKSCYNCGEKHTRKSRYCSRYCFEFNKTRLKEKKKAKKQLQS